MNEKELTQKALTVKKNHRYAAIQHNGNNIYVSIDSWITITDRKDKIITVYAFNPPVTGFICAYEYFLIRAKKISYLNNLFGKILGVIGNKQKIMENSMIKMKVLLDIARIYADIARDNFDRKFKEPSYEYQCYLLASASARLDSWRSMIRNELSDLDKNIVLVTEEYDEKKQIGDFFCKQMLIKIQETQSLNQSRFLVDYNNLVSAYKKFLDWNWDKQFIDKYLCDDAHYTLTIRENIHQYIQFCKNFVRIDSEVFQRLKQLDKKLISLLRDNYRVPVQKDNNVHPTNHWWWHLHELDKLSKKDLETV